MCPGSPSRDGGVWFVPDRAVGLRRGWAPGMTQEPIRELEACRSFAGQPNGPVERHHAVVVKKPS